MVFVAQIYRKCRKRLESRHTLANKSPDQFYDLQDYFVCRENVI